jgi:hypothetical protein
VGAGKWNNLKLVGVKEVGVTTESSSNLYKGHSPFILIPGNLGIGIRKKKA